MYQAIRFAMAVYRNGLARRIYEIGFHITLAKHGFEIEGASNEVLKRFSKRSQQRDVVVREMEQKLGRKLSNNEVSYAVHRSRASKFKGISTTEVPQDGCIVYLSKRTAVSGRWDKIFLVNWATV